MNLSKNAFYSPLDQSQIEFIPSDFNIVTGSLESRRRNEINDASSNGDQSITNQSESILGSRRGSLTISEMISQNMSRVHSRESSVGEPYHLTRLSTDSPNSSIVDRIRYRIILRLNTREKQLIRESWEIILNEDVARVHSKSVQDLSTARNASAAGVVGTDAASAYRKLSSSEVVTNRMPQENDNNVTFASSMFCSQFYANLLAMEPELERQFPSIRHQAVAFASVLNSAINNLENLQALEDDLVSLGKRHARILNIEPPHFEIMGAAFLKTLQERFGIQCTIEIEEVWSRLYSYLANSILQSGIDPILQVNLDEEEIIFPVPNLVDGTDMTVSRLSSRSSHDGARSLRSMFSGRGFGSQMQYQDRGGQHAYNHLDMDGSTIKSSRSGMNKMQPAQTSRKQVLPASRSKPQSKSKNKRVTSKLNLSSNKECALM